MATSRERATQVGEQIERIRHCLGELSRFCGVISGDYEIFRGSESTVTVTDVGSNYSEGTDTLVGIEVLAFQNDTGDFTDDTTMSVSDIPVSASNISPEISTLLNEI